MAGALLHSERENTGEPRYIPVNWFVLPRPQYAGLTNHGGNSGAAVSTTIVGLVFVSVTLGEFSPNKL